MSSKPGGHNHEHANHNHNVPRRSQTRSSGATNLSAEELELAALTALLRRQFAGRGQAPANDWRRFMADLYPPVTPDGATQSGNLAAEQPDRTGDELWAIPTPEIVAPHSLARDEAMYQVQLALEQHWRSKQITAPLMFCWSGDEPLRADFARQLAACWNMPFCYLSGDVDAEMGNKKAGARGHGQSSPAKVLRAGGILCCSVTNASGGSLPGALRELLTGGIQPIHTTEDGGATMLAVHPASTVIILAEQAGEIMAEFPQLKEVRWRETPLEVEARWFMTALSSARSMATESRSRGQSADEETRRLSGISLRQATTAARWWRRWLQAAEQNPQLLAPTLQEMTRILWLAMCCEPEVTLDQLRVFVRYPTRDEDIALVAELFQEWVASLEREEWVEQVLA